MKKIYTIATAHLDTVWNWDFEHVITVCLRDTLYQNFEHFEKFPTYRFNFEGTYRYELFEEYYPEEFKKLKEYVAMGKWNPTGSAFENGDVNMPSPESLFRNILYGNLYFERNFGKRSNDIFLPDCFGFGYALPSIIAHANLKGFSTQKLTWGGAYGRPFDIGIWKGVDGNSCYASIDAKSYCMTFKEVRTKSDLVKKLDSNIEKYDLPWTFAYHGVGDKGGAPKEKSVETVEREVSENSSKDIQVLVSSPTEFFDDMDSLSDEAKAKLPVWDNELVMTDHGVGSYTSRAFSKRMNRRNEELADMAERAGVVAEALTGYEYPKTNLEKAWKHTIAHTFHDDITGTSVSRVYKRSWNDLVIAANQFSSCFEGASKQIIANLDTSWVKGTAIVVSNPLEFERKSVVDFEVPACGYKYIRVFDARGNEIPSQVNSVDDKVIKGCICATVPAMGYKVYDVMLCQVPCSIQTGIRAGGNTIENFKYMITFDKNGDMHSIIDKSLGNKELLERPIRFELNKYKGASHYPAWELRYKQINKMPWECAEKGRVEIIENGPCRVTAKVVQTCGKSSFTYIVSLCAGVQYISVYNEIEWREWQRALHNGFYLTVKNNKATYDLGLGAIERNKASKNLYAVPAQKWVNINDEQGNCGVSIFSDSKYGWFMKDESTMKLTVLHSPRNYYRFDSSQGMLDFGKNRYSYAIYSHGVANLTLTQMFARDFNQPMATFVATKHPGELGSEFSFIQVSNPAVIVRAVKKAEETDEIVIRVNEGSGTPVDMAEIKLGNGIVSAREIYASEEEKGEAVVDNGKLVFSMKPYEVKSFAVRIISDKVGIKATQTPVTLPYNIDVTKELPGVNEAIPRHILPETLNCAGINFRVNNYSELNAVVCNGQSVNVSGNKLYLLCASLYGDKPFNINLGGIETGIRVCAINERIGAWDLYEFSETGYIKPDRLGLEISHTETNGKINPASQLYFFVYEINIKDVPAITLPKGNGLIVLAATTTNETSDSRMLTALYDRLEKRPFEYKMTRKEIRHDKKMKRLFKKKSNFS